MHNSTKYYVKHRILQLMGQCGITIDDIELAVSELKPKKIYKLPDVAPVLKNDEPYDPEIHGW